MLVLSAGFTARAQQLAGDWQGTLKAGGAELRLVLHISKTADGSMKAALDSIDQGAYGIPVTSISVEASKLKFEVSSVHGSYAGTVSADGNSIQGTWTQGQSLPLDFSRLREPAKHATAAKPPDIDGAWLGTLDTGTAKLRVVFHIETTSAGLAATMDSIDQGAKGIPVSKVTRNGSSLTLEVGVAGGRFEGKISPDLSVIDGTWTQGGTTLPLVLRRVKGQAEIELQRPQTPVKPYPYQEKEVSFEGAAPGVRLSGTLTAPRGKGPFPAVVLIAGSGPHDRNETVFGHQIFLVLSDYLTRKGIAVLRYDKRGVGRSGGDYATATTADFAHDAESAAAFLRAQPGIDPRRVGLIGHSEGGIIAPMVAARDPKIAFIVMMAGSGVPGDEILVEQTLRIREASGMAPARAEKDTDQERKLLALVKSQPPGPALDDKVRAEFDGKVPQASLGTVIHQLDSPWFRYFISYDPASALERVKCPVLALIGSKDTQVPPQQNLPAIRKALRAGGNNHFEVDELPGLNHLFQPATTGAPSEYGQIETTIAPSALAKISSWILQQAE